MGVKSQVEIMPMIKNLVLLCLPLILVLGKPQGPAPGAASSGDLESVLTQMDREASSFKSAQADFDWDNYQKVVDETDKQKGEVYFRRIGKEVEIMFDFRSPVPKQVLFKGGKVQLYNPKADQITEYEAGENKSDVEAFLSLGFGARGHDLTKSYDVKMAGWDPVDSFKAAKLELTSKSVRIRNMFSQFVLWIDPQRDVPIKQQVFEPSGDYWLTHYTGVKLNVRISDDHFRIKTTPNTKIVKPR